MVVRTSRLYLLLRGALALASAACGVVLALRWQSAGFLGAGCLGAHLLWRPDSGTVPGGTVLEFDGNTRVRLHTARGSRLRRLSGVGAGPGFVALRFADAQGPARWVLWIDALPPGAARSLLAADRLAASAPVRPAPQPRAHQPWVPRPGAPARGRRPRSGPAWASAAAPGTGIPQPGQEDSRAEPAAAGGAVRRSGTRIVSRATGRDSG